jgi:hypothetical protein
MAKTSTNFDTETRQVALQNSIEDSQSVAVQNRDDAEKSAPNGELAQKKEYPTGISRVLILGPVTLAYFLVFLDLAVLSTATPAITSRFNSLVDVGWYGFERDVNHFSSY